MSTNAVDPVFNLIVFNCRNITQKHPFTLATAWDLSSFSFFGRSTAKEYMMFASREVMARVSIPGQRLTVPYKVEPLNKTYTLHTTKTSEGLGIICITEESYKPRVAHALLTQGLDAFTEALKVSGKSLESITQQQDMEIKCPKMAELLTKYQKPGSVDNIAQINKDLDETKDILMKSIEQLLERGEKLQDLMQKSEDLSFASKEYYDKARDMNGCWGWCSII